jgi:hypothetical protein
MARYITPEMEADYNSRIVEVEDKARGRTRKFFLQKDGQLIEMMQSFHTLEECAQLYELTKRAGRIRE